MKKSLLFALVSVALLVGCKKDSDSDSPTDTKTLLVKTWEAQTVVGNTGGSAPLSLPVYTKGNAVNVVPNFSKFYITLKTDETFESVDVAETKTTGKWVLAADNKTLTLTPTTGSAMVYTIEAISPTASTLKYTVNTTNPNAFDQSVIALAKQVNVTIGTGASLTFNLIPR